MQIKRFVAPTMAEAVKSVRNEFGPDAVILQTGKVRQPGLLGFFRPAWVAVTAGLEEERDRVGARGERTHSSGHAGVSANQQPNTERTPGKNQRIDDSKTASKRPAESKQPSKPQSNNRQGQERAQHTEKNSGNHKQSKQSGGKQHPNQNKPNASGAQNGRKPGNTPGSGVNASAGGGAVGGQKSDAPAATASAGAPKATALQVASAVTQPQVRVTATPQPQPQVQLRAATQPQVQVTPAPIQAPGVVAPMSVALATAPVLPEQASASPVPVASVAAPAAPSAAPVAAAETQVAATHAVAHLAPERNVAEVSAAPARGISAPTVEAAAATETTAHTTTVGAPAQAAVEAASSTTVASVTTPTSPMVAERSMIPPMESPLAANSIGASLSLQTQTQPGMAQEFPTSHPAAGSGNGPTTAFATNTVVYQALQEVAATGFAAVSAGTHTPLPPSGVTTAPPLSPLQAWNAAQARSQVKLAELATLHLMERLRQQEVASDYLLDLSADLRLRVAQGGEAPQQHLVRLLAERFPPQQPWPLTNGPYVVPLVGPTGVGKTTTVAKLAATYALMLGHRVGLVTVDTYRVAAVEQLRTYADILNVPLEVLYSPREAPAALDRLSDRQLILIDTAGRSPHNSAQMNELAAFLAEMGAYHAHLVISATTRYSDLVEIVDTFSAHVQVNGLIVTKLDETRTYGCLYNAAQRTKKPIAFVTNGQGVPEDILAADPVRLAGYMVGVES